MVEPEAVAVSADGDGRLLTDDLFSNQSIDHPFDFFAALRDADPVHYDPRWDGWVVTRYEDVLAGFKDYESLSSDRFAGPWGSDGQRPSAHEKLYEVLSDFFVWKDPPEHTRVRGLMNKAFTPRSVEQLRPRTREIVQDLGASLRGGRNADFLNGFAFHLPVIVISEYLGVPATHREDIKRWSEDLGGVIFVKAGDKDRKARANRAVEGLSSLFRELVEARRSEPREDLLSGMLQAGEGDDGLSDDEIISNAILMIFAGHETTMNLLSNGIVAFDRFPDQWRRLQDDPDLVRPAAEEILRYDGPIRAMARWARSETEIGGQRIKPLDRVLLVPISANHDPRAFEDPESFDIDRSPNKHLAFGYGIHMCLGAALARMETQEAFRFLAREFDRIEVAEEKLQYKETIISRSLKTLHINAHDRAIG